MKYTLWIHEKRLAYIERYLTVKVLVREDDMLKIEINLISDKAVYDLFHAGIEYGIDITERLREEAV
jgi:hypothetical protein